MDAHSTRTLQEILSDAGLSVPDGRPLHQYKLSPSRMATLEGTLRTRLAPGIGHVPMPASFVLWAAEHIRAKFPGGQLTWMFLFESLGLHEDRTAAVRWVEEGLRWWRRGLRISDADQRMFLYSLMAEGGLPQALVAQAGLYRRVVLGLLADIEAEGGTQAAALAERIAARWVGSLPQTFRTIEFGRLLADLALALARLRAMLPEDLSGPAAERWLNVHHPDWVASLPLRISPEIAEQLIRPALGEARGAKALAGGPLATRELHKDQAGHWRWFLKFSDHGFLPNDLLPGADGLRLRLLPLGAASEIAGAPVYFATPDQGGWRVARFGHTRQSRVPFEPRLPLIFGAYADGMMKGEVVIAPGVPDPGEAPGLWRPADPAEGSAATRLSPQPGAGRARAAFLWLLASETAEPVAGEGLSLSAPEPATNGKLWRISGRGTLTVGTGHRLQMETGASDEAPEARLIPVGSIVSGWRTERDHGPVYHGVPRIFGERGNLGLRLLSDLDLRIRPSGGRTLFGNMVEWIEKGESMARVRLICVPSATRFSLAEESAGRVRLSVSGLPSGTRLALRADRVEARTDVSGGTEHVLLTANGAPPGQLTLRLSSIASGEALELVVPWPARTGLVLDPNGARLERDRPIAVDSLRGWRALVPAGEKGDLQLRLVSQAAVALPVAGEVPLYPYVPLIRAMLAQGGPDAQVNLNLIVRGEEGRRLEIRRYDDEAKMEGDLLRAGLARGTHSAPQTALAAQFDKRPIVLHAVDLTSASGPVVMDTTSGRDLRALLGETGGPWLVQARLGDRIQRAVAWAPKPIARSTRQDRIVAFARDWHRLVVQPLHPDWDRLWNVIVNLGRGGDAGIADQVQALGHAPAAAVSFMLRVRDEHLADALALDIAAPIFWPILPISAFVDAIQSDYRRRLARLEDLFDGKEAIDESKRGLCRRIEEVLSIRAELAGHFGAALVQAGLADLMLTLNQSASLPKFLFPDPSAELTELAQVAARRFDRLPYGVSGIVPRHRPDGPPFNRYAQIVIDAPLVAAELATGQRPSASSRDIFSLINLRLVDPGYFDAALPAAIAFVLKETNR